MIGYFSGDLRLRTRVAVAQRIEPFNDYKDGCEFESHQSHASSEAPGFSHLEPLALFWLKNRDFYLRLGSSPQAKEKDLQCDLQVFFLHSYD